MSAHNRSIEYLGNYPPNPAAGGGVQRRVTFHGNPFHGLSSQPYPTGYRLRTMHYSQSEHRQVAPVRLVSAGARSATDHTYGRARISGPQSHMQSSSPGGVHDRLQMDYPPESPPPPLMPLSSPSAVLNVFAAFNNVHNALQQLGQSIEMMVQRQSRQGTALNKLACCVCLDSFEAAEQDRRPMKITKCGHLHCSQCLDSLMLTSRHCAVCRKRIGRHEPHRIYLSA